MPRSLNVMLVVSAVLVATSVAAFLFMLYMMQAGSGLGTIGVVLFMIVATPALISVMLTAGLWMFRRNRLVIESISVLKQEPDRKKEI